MECKLTSFHQPPSSHSSQKKKEVLSPRSRRRFDSRDPKTIFVKDHSFPLEIAEELNIVLDMFVRDFITEWFAESVSTNDQFQKSVQHVLIDVIAGLYEQFRASERSGSLLLLLNDALRILRDHLYWYKQMKSRAAAAHPNLFYSNPILRK